MTLAVLATLGRGYKIKEDGLIDKVRLKEYNYAKRYECVNKIIKGVQ